MAASWRRLAWFRLAQDLVLLSRRSMIITEAMRGKGVIRHEV